MSVTLAPRTPSLAWATRAQHESALATRWHRGAVSDEEPSADGTFPGPPVGAWLPPSVTTAATEAQRAGGATAWECLSLLFAGPWWRVAALEHLWAPWSPDLDALALVVERYGVPSELHQRDAARLSRLTVVLPEVRPARGSAQAARAIARALDTDEMERIAAPPRPGPEIFICRSGAGWGSQPPTVGGLRLSGGLVVATPARSPRPEVVAALDVLTDGLPRVAMRLLPVWITPCLPAPAENGAGSTP